MLLHLIVQIKSARLQLHLHLHQIHGDMVLVWNSKTQFSVSVKIQHRIVQYGNWFIQ